MRKVIGDDFGVAGSIRDDRLRVLLRFMVRATRPGHTREPGDRAEHHGCRRRQLCARNSYRIHVTYMADRARKRTATLREKAHGDCPATASLPRGGSASPFI